MNIILLSGGSGTRLWPLSNEVRSKQFLKIFRRPDGGYESMLQRVYRMIRETNPQSSVVIATSDKQVEAIRAQVGKDVAISTEPCRRNTFPAIALAAAYLKDQEHVADTEVTVVCPIDSLVDSTFFADLPKLAARLAHTDENLVLLGIHPDSPSEKYGYIVPAADADESEVRYFVEKPEKARAEQLIAEGALWNGGVFAFRNGYVLKKAAGILGTSDYRSLFEGYADLQKISFDYAVSEHEPKIGVVKYNGVWDDIGTWDTLTRAMSEPLVGKVVADRCEDVNAINELGVPMALFGVKDIIVAASPDGILVSGREASPDIKKTVEGLSKRPMYEEREWGRYVVLDYSVAEDGTETLTRQILITAGSHISYHTHAQRSEHWTVTYGRGRLIIEGEEQPFVQGDMRFVKAGTRHAIYAETDLHMIEVQLGDDLSEEDIHRLDWDWSLYG